jgi:hypothetical protein
LTFSSDWSSGTSSAIVASSAPSADPEFGTTHTSRESGWRTFTLASSRAARASVASVRMRAIARSSAGSMSRGSPRVNGARWTEVPVSSRWIQSVMKGAKGASSRQLTASTSCSVANAARLSSVSTS